MAKRQNKYPKLVSTRITTELWDSLQKLVKSKQKDFPRYSEADAVRSAIVNHLKTKKLIDKEKDYL